MRGNNTISRFLILHSGFAENHVDNAKKQIAALGGARLQHVLFEDSDPSWTLQNKVQGAFAAARVSTIGACLRQELFRGQTIEQPPPTEIYVGPTVVPATGPQSTDSAVVMLLKWMRGSHPAAKIPSRVGILLGPAGTGKTALAIELFKEFMRSHQSDVRAVPFPLLIDRFAWIGHQFRDSTDNLAVLLGYAISTQFGFQPAIARIQRCLRYGAICPILDGFDELCATKPSHFGADSTLAALVNTLEGVDGSRILLTCRESFWHDNIGAGLQAKVTAFRLSPFSEEQRREYLGKRFPKETDRIKRERTSGLLRKISQFRTSINSAKGSIELSNLSFLPWVVQFTAEAADSDSLENAVFDTLGSTPSVDPLGHVLWQFCQREQQRIGISLKPESQIRIFSNLAATCDEWFPIDQVDMLHGLLSGEPTYQGDPSHIEFLRKHGFLRIVGKETRNNCRFEYPEVQDYLRARIAVDAICGETMVLGDDDVFCRCATEQMRLVDFTSLLLRWRLPKDGIVDAIAAQRLRFVAMNNDKGDLARAGLLQILLRTLRDNDALTPPAVCRYFGDKAGRNIDKAIFFGLFSRLDFRGLRIKNTVFRDAHLEHCRFDEQTIFENCYFDSEFSAALNCKGLGDVDLLNCQVSDKAMAIFRLHENKVAHLPIDPTHIKEACHHILSQFQIGQMGLRNKSRENVEHEARKASRIGDDILAELLRGGVLTEERAGTRKTLKVADRSSVGLFIQQAITRGNLAQVVDKLVKRHVRTRNV
jgi:hypothetical protein